MLEIEIYKLTTKGCKNVCMYSRFMPETILRITMNACACDLN